MLVLQRCARERQAAEARKPARSKDRRVQRSFGVLPAQACRCVLET